MADVAVAVVMTIPTMVAATESVDGGWALNWVVMSAKVANAGSDDIADVSLGMLVDAQCQSVQAKMRGQIVVVDPPMI
jgi:hypothetical protein